MLQANRMNILSKHISINNLHVLNKYTSLQTHNRIHDFYLDNKFPKLIFKSADHKKADELTYPCVKLIEQSRHWPSIKLIEQSQHWFNNTYPCVVSKADSLLWFNGKERDKYDRSGSGSASDGPLGGSNSNDMKYLVLLSMMLLTSMVLLQKFHVRETSWPIFLRLMLQKGEVEKLEVFAADGKVYVYLAKGASVNGIDAIGEGPHYFFTISSVDSFDRHLKLAQEEMGIDPTEFIPVVYPTKYDPNKVAFGVGIAMVALFGFVIYYLLRKAGSSNSSPMNMFSGHTRAKTTVIKPGSGKGVKFKEVAGMAEAKQEVMEFVEYLQNPTRFKELGAKIPKGALMCGPPGTGKTLLAKAVATEASVPFLSMAGSDFVEMYSGVGSARVRDMFAQARKEAPCIVYIDEIDAIGRSRMAVTGNSEQESTLNQLLVEMDGMNTVEGVVMLASTNRLDILDKALLRPGRFDRIVAIDLPTLQERKEIFEIYLKQLKLHMSIKQKKLDASVKRYAKMLAELTPGKSGADIANICNEAALHAARLNEKIVDESNFQYAIERVIAGIQKRTNPLSPEERQTVAYHEAGHAIVGWMLEYTEPILKISVVPRTSNPLGYTQKFPLDIKLHTNEQLFDTMCANLGGRVAEALVFDKITTGAEDDLKLVTRMAYEQIVTFGMNERVGPISFPLKKQNEISRKPYSDRLARMIDQEASALVAKAHIVTKEVLIKHKAKLDELAKTLLEKEVVNHEDLLKLLGPAPYGDKRASFYLSNSGNTENIDDV